MKQKVVGEIIMKKVTKLLLLFCFFFFNLFGGNIRTNKFLIDDYWWCLSMCVCVCVIRTQQQKTTKKTKLSLV